MKHLGDITKIDGSRVPMVDIVTGGSPCQDLSIAGRREGLAGERSGLFMEQIRIVKEMRNECAKQLRMRGADDDIRFLRPRFMVWENVRGAITSGTPRGEDFRIVLEETAKVADENAIIPRPANGKWSSSGCIMGDGWSIAWRIHDAQFWGVPQRRKRIALVADYGGLCAPEILFERKGLPRNTEQGETEKQGIAGNIGEGTDSASIGVDVYNQEITGEVAATLTAACGGTNTSGCKVIDRQTDRYIVSDGTSLHRQRAASPDGNEYDCEHIRCNARSTGNPCDRRTIIIDSNNTDARYKIAENGIFQTLKCRMGTGGNNVPMVIE